MENLGPMARVISRETIEEQVFHTLRRAILEGKLKPGQRLVQEELAEFVGTSRIPVRGALKTLARSGLVTADAKGFYSVTTFGPSDIEEIYELRAHLEPYAAVKAMPGLTGSDLHDLRRLNEEMLASGEAGHTDRWTQQNQDFHQSIYKASRQPRLVGIIRDMWFGRPTFSPIKQQGHLRRSYQEHEAILEALEAGDARLVEERVRNHILAALNTWRVYLAARDGTPD